MTEEPLVIAVITTGVLVGALLPDTDASDSAIWYSGLSAIFGHAMVHLVLPVVRLVFHHRHFTYIDEHRGSLHSVYAIGISSLIFLGFGTLLVALVSGYLYGTILHMTGYFFTTVFTLGLFCGGILHLAEDCCTRSGIFPFHPFHSVWVHGRIRTGDLADRRPAGMQVTAFFTAGVLLIAKIHYRIPAEISWPVSAAVLVLIWAVFFAVAGTRWTGS